ncbi:MAG: hypothetical protein ACR2QC_08605 [Gammaproteobacteria bacterium]
MELKRFRLSPEWRFFYIFGYRQIRHCPQKQKTPPFRRKPESHSCVAGILLLKNAAPPTN